METWSPRKEAFQLHSIKATPIAGGGLCEAEGAFVLCPLRETTAAIKACLNW